MNPQDFAQKIKNKYPQYKDVDDIELARKIVQKYPQYSSQVDFTKVTPQKDGGILDEIKGDVTETVSGLISDIESRADKTGVISQAEKSGEQGKLRSLFQRFGQGVGAASDVIGRTVIGAGKAILPQRAEDAISGAVEKGVEKVAGLEPVQNLLSRYQKLQEENPALARDIDASLGIGTLAVDLGTMGIGGRGINLATKTANKGVDVVGKGIGATGRGARRVGFELEGALTGTSQETLEQAFQAAFKGGEEGAQFTKALRGQVTPESLVENVRNSLNTVRSTNSTQYRQSLEQIVDNVVDTSGAKTRLTNKLNEFNIAVTPEGLDFSKSKFRTVPQAQTKIQQAFNEVAQLGDKTTVGSVDTTRQALKELMLTGDDNSARSANALIEEAVSTVRDSGKQVDGYEKLLVEFGENADFLNEITRSLASGDKQTIDTAYRRLATSLKTNNERRMNLIKELDEATGGFILSDIAGQQLSEALPRGLFRQIGAGLAGAGVVTGGVSSSLLVPMVFASPRVAGEVIRALGISSKKASIIIDAIDSARKTLNSLDVPLPLASPISESVEKSLQETQSQETQ